MAFEALLEEYERRRAKALAMGGEEKLARRKARGQLNARERVAALVDAGSFDEIGMGACRMLEKGYADGWGFGRHVIGSNFFHYVRDPWMSLAEYFSDIDYIPADAQWQPTNYALEDALYVWGPKPPEAFGVNFEAVE